VFTKGRWGRHGSLKEVTLAENQTNQTNDKNEKVSGFGPKGTPNDQHLAENSQENLNKKLDHAVDETFPGSDPVSVKITK
jgi:hypothetical protein